MSFFTDDGRNKSKIDPVETVFDPIHSDFIPIHADGNVQMNANQLDNCVHSFSKYRDGVHRKR